MVARIYRPAPNAMQSGRGKSRNWVLEYEPEAPRSIDPLMGYTSSTDMRQQVKLRFDTVEEAESYARRSGIPYRIEPAHDASVKKVSYPDNFRHDRKFPWTH
ncbi:ETC complex I subunit [Pelagibacterium limicola]|uniref:ETC complex I subunit n=1 Tax=Pelagibacterium limicola TaxID=2791022 RepID=UPI0018AFAA01|nr:ETC complex I subunit [Pelagibacterium limicola]